MRRRSYRRAVVATSQDGREQRFPSIKEAAAAVGLRSPCRISTACVTGHRCAGLHWRYDDEKEC